MAMRISTGILCTAAVVFLSSAVGLLGTWALAASTILGMVGAIGVVTVLEGRDFANAVTDPAGLRPSHLRVAGLARIDDSSEAA